MSSYVKNDYNQLHLISDQDMYLFLIDSIRGGICQLSKKYSKADNRYTRNQHNEWKNKKIQKKLKTNNLNKYLLYLDANNLYEYSMSQKLAYKNFKWSNDLTLDKIQTGIYEIDISIPENLHYKFKDYPLAPEMKSIPKNNLSEYQKYLNNKLNIKYSESDKKLILDLSIKKNCKVYYKNLEYYMQLGIKIDKIHKILTFDDLPFLKEYIDLNTELRKYSKNDLEKDLFKLMNNDIFGKSMENVLNKSNVKLINNDPKKLLELIKEPNFEHIHKISDKQVLFQSKPVKTKFNKPIYLGACILETSKLHMYKFWYDYLKVKYGDNINLIYTDTDSFVLDIFTDDVYEDMKNDNHLFDFSEYPKDHKCYNVKNKKKLVIFNDELHGNIMTEFSCLKPKMYSFEFIENNTIYNETKHKGVKKSVDIYHSDYKKCLYNEEILYKEFYNLQLNKQNIYLDKINKMALNPFESKRHWINNINSLPYGYVE